MDELDPPLLRDLDLAIESDAEESPRSLFRRFGLSQRGVGYAQFRKHAYRLRQALPEGEKPEPDADVDPDMEDLGRGARRELKRLLTSGGVKPYVLINLAKLCLADQLIDIRQQAEDRAAEKHAAWRREVEAKLAVQKSAADANLDALAEEEDIPAKVRDAVKQLYGISL